MGVRARSRLSTILPARDRRDEKDNLAGGDPHEIWYRFSGRQRAYVGNNGTIDIDYLNSVPQEQGGGPAPGTSFADFDLAYNPINAYEQGSRGGMYSVQSGDTLAGIASALWGDANLWYKIAETNGLTAESALPEGMSLIIPAGVQSNANNATTFKPYDPLEVLGSTSPTSPAPKKNKCGAFGQILLAVIAIAVSVVAGPVAGSIVSQSVGVATGIQDKFSWNAVGLAWVSSFIAGPIGSAAGNAAAQAGASALTQAVVSATVSNVVTQGIGVATGMQKEFSWAGVAAAGVGAGVGAGVHAALPTSARREREFRRALSLRPRQRRDAESDRGQRFRRQCDRQPARRARANHRGGHSRGNGGRSSRSGQMSQAEHRSRTDKYNAALDAGATPDQAEALAHDLGLDGANVPMWQGGRSAPIEVGLPTFMPGYEPDPAVALRGFFSSLRPTDIVNRQSVIDYYDAASRYSVYQAAQSVGVGDVLRLYGAAAADSPRAIGQAFLDALNAPLVPSSDPEYYERQFYRNPPPPPTYGEFMTSIAKAATGITAIENAVGHHQNAMRALEAGDWDAAVSEAQGAMFEGGMAATVIAGEVSVARSAMAETRALRGMMSLGDASAAMRASVATELEALQALGRSNNSMGPAISVATDLQTGQRSLVYLNNAAGDLPASLNPILAERLEAARGLDYVRTAGAGSHAEVYAVNELLNARAGARLDNIAVYTQQIGGRYNGLVKPPCPHCNLLLNEVNYAH